jgi:elongator complex protein 2
VEHENVEQPDSLLVYASHGIVNVMHRAAHVELANGMVERVWYNTATLRSECCDRVSDQLATSAANESATASRKIITALCSIPFMVMHDTDGESNGSALTSIETLTLGCGYSDGTLTVWRRRAEFVGEEGAAWLEEPIDFASYPPLAAAAVTCLDGMRVYSPADTSSLTLLLLVGSSFGATIYYGRQSASDPHLASRSWTIVHCESLWGSLSLTSTAAASVGTVQLQPLRKIASSCRSNGILALVGTASPRHNKILLYSVSDAIAHLKRSSLEEPAFESPPSSVTPSSWAQFLGGLTGHENWITSLAWNVSDSSPMPHLSVFLATGSQDDRIRLWKFTTTPHNSGPLDEAPPLKDETVSPSPSRVDELGVAVESDSDDEDEAFRVADEDAANESRLDILDPSCGTITRVTLEALLLGHEDNVTSICWHPNPLSYYGSEYLLISSSMDRTILLWAPGKADGIWIPISRVGAAGGILGGSIGSTLLGFVNVAVDPVGGLSLIGQAYGGALHSWTMDSSLLETFVSAPDSGTSSPLDAMDVEERAALVHWKASPCVTGHFNGVTDLCWEASRGDYLLTVSSDQTCRLWAPVSHRKKEVSDSIWVELARPQVHGYDLCAIASASSSRHRHLMVSGADEKELRVFDATKTTIRTLKAIVGGFSESGEVDPDSARVDRAFIPSLGLSNLASANDGAEEDAGSGSDHRVTDSFENSSVDRLRLPLERDLGVITLWPEVQKMFGHNSELFCLASSAAARTSPELKQGASEDDTVLVASSTKARDVENAAIRIWDVAKGQCVQVLKGGHKSTVATLAFSPCGHFLVSSGKDRRLCLWSRPGAGSEFRLAWAQDGAHKRIVWSADFVPHDGRFLVSGSRDGCIRLWRLGAEMSVQELYHFAPTFTRLGKPDAVTALSFAPKPPSGVSALLAVGLESGRLELWRLPLEPGLLPVVVYSFPSWQCHAAAVTKLAWRPCRDAEQGQVMLASASLDHGCRIYEIGWQTES